MILRSARRMREIDATAAAAGTATLDLMRNAGRCVARIAADFREPFLLLCGKGNNGGDGLVAAISLHAAGRACRVWLAADPGVIPSDSLTVLREAERLGIPIESPADHGQLPARFLEEAATVIDALLGTGFTPPAREPMAGLIEALNASGKPVISVDLPSGVDADSGVAAGPIVNAAVTVTFGAPKAGLFIHPAAARAGRVVVADIGHPPALLAEPSAGDRLLLDSTWFRRALPARNAAAHKGDFGHLLVAAGSRRYPGAAQLAALGGLRSGAGLVTLAAPGALAPALVPALPELMPLMLEESTGAFAAGAASTLAGHFRGKDALVLGPGLTITPDTVSFAREVIATAPLPLVVDADALTILAEAPNPLTARTSPTILTPHPGELARLLSRPVAEIERDRLGAAQEAAERFGAVVVLKGAGTLVASPGQPAAVNAGGNPGMASGGMGDLLAGLIGGFLAQGLPPLVAACLGVYLHGVAGDLVAETRPWGFRACEVADGIPSAVGRLLDGYDDVDCR